MKIIRGALIFLGYVFSYVLGLVICFVSVAIVNGNWNHFNSAEVLIASLLGFFIVAPGLALGFKRLMRNR